MRILFICNQNQNRSVTAEHVFRGKFQTKSAGLFNNTPVTEKQIAWADTIVVMESSQRQELAKRFPQQFIQKRILTLNIPDMYYRDQPELVSLLKHKMKRLL